MLRRLTTAFICLLMLCATPAMTLVAPSLFSSTSPEPAATEAQRHTGKRGVFVNFTLVRRIYCEIPETGVAGRGTGVVISETTIMTAEHVIKGTCIDEATGLPLIPFYTDYDHDIAFMRIEGATFGKRFELSCEGFRGGVQYSAIGYMYGDDLVETHVTATFVHTRSDSKNRQGRPADHLRILKGDIYKGMSGGPIVDEDGVVIGLNTATDHEGTAFSRELRDTVLCNPNHAH